MDKLRVYDIEHSQLLQKFQWKGSLVSMVLSPDGDVVACGSQDNSAFLAEIHSRRFYDVWLCLQTN